MPGKTTVGSALARADGKPGIRAATATTAVNARSARWRTMDSDPSGSARRRPQVEITGCPFPTLGVSRRPRATLPRGRQRDGVAPLAGRARLPARRSEDVAQAITQPRRRPPVTGDRNVFAGLQLPDVERVDLLGQAVVRAEHLRLKAAEQAVPDDENAAVVLVEVHLVHPVVH